MKIQTVLAVLLAAASATVLPICKGPAPPQCKHLPNHNAHECQRLIVNNCINIATCQAPATTVTSTQTKCATRTMTKTLPAPPKITKIYTTITKTGKPITPPTVTVTQMSTKIKTTIVTNRTTMTAIQRVTNSETKSITKTESITTISISTTTVPFNDPITCAPKKRAAGYGLPRACSCFLTSTKPAAMKTHIVTKYRPAVTHTVYKTGGTRQVVRKTVTVFRYANGQVLSAPVTTKTGTTTITQTDRTITTITDSQTTTATQVKEVLDTVTVTKTESALATTTQNPCANMGSPSTRELSSPDIQLVQRSDAFGLSGARDCCEACYRRPNCVLFRLGGDICEVFASVPSFSDSCTSPLCPRGFVGLDIRTADGKNYYLGPCSGGVQA